MARGSSLSDDSVIDEINRNFIAVDNNISDQGWPADTPALQPWMQWLSKHPGNAHNGFTTSVVITPDGQMALGTSGSGYIAEWHSSICYDPAKYLTFLQDARQKFSEYSSIAQMPNSGEKYSQMAQLQRQIMIETHERNRPQYARASD